MNLMLYFWIIFFILNCIIVVMVNVNICPLYCKKYVINKYDLFLFFICCLLDTQCTFYFLNFWQSGKSVNYSFFFIFKLYLSYFINYRLKLHNATVTVAKISPKVTFEIYFQQALLTKLYLHVARGELSVFDVHRLERKLQVKYFMNATHFESHFRELMGYETCN